jgi:hypothetical protein
MVRETVPVTQASDLRMGPDMAHPQRDSNPHFITGRTAAAVLLPLFFVLFCTVPAWPEAKDGIFEQSGILYPEGFDRNTVGEVQGKVHGLVFPASGPVRFLLTSNKETYSVLVSPRWYWEDLGIRIADGEEVRIGGSKSLGKDGNLYIIAQEIRIPSQNKSFILRNDMGRPLWKGAGQGSAGAQRGPGSPSRGFGGMGSGAGGMGRGRR